MSRDAVARELDEGNLEEWRCPPVPLRRAWHLVARAGDQLPPTAQLLLAHLADRLNGNGEDRFQLVDGDRLRQRQHRPFLGGTRALTS